MNKRKTVISTILTLLLLISGMIAYKTLSSEDSNVSIENTKEVIRPVQAKQISLLDAENFIDIDGRITAYEKMNITANVSGILLSNSKIIKKGTYVEEGELLFDIEQKKNRFNLHAQRSNLLNALTLTLPDLKLDYPDAFNKWKTYIDNFNVKESVKELPIITDEREKHYMAVKNIYSLYFDIKSSEAALEDFQIFAPFSGVITHAEIFPGTMVMPGQLLASLINTSRFELEVSVLEEDLGFIRIGQTVNLALDQTDKKRTGKVSRIGAQIDPATQRVPIFITVTGKGLKEGMYLKGKVKGSSIKEVVEIPKKLVTNQDYVYVVKDSILYLEKIFIQKRSGDFVYAKNFDASLWVVHDNPKTLFEGQKVIPIFN